MDHTTAAAWQNEILTSRAESEKATASAAERTDAQLVALVLAGDEAAFENLFDRYKKLVASIAARYFRRPEEIDDIIQVSFARAFFHLKSFRAAQDFSFAGWIGKIATNASLDQLRAQKRKPENLLCELSDAQTETLLGEAASRGNAAENHLIGRDLAEKLLSKLAAEDRAVLQMLDAEELSVGEVAEITGWSRSKIKMRAHRARRALRKILKRFL